MKRMVLAAVLVTFCGGFWVMQISARLTPVVDPVEARNELMRADRAFDKLTLEKGLEGWMDFMAEDAVRLSPMGAKAFQGKMAVRTLDAKLFAEPGTRLRWEPVDGGVFEGGDIGFTTGTGRMVRTKDDGTEETLWKSAYITLWRKNKQGQWKVILDTGAEQD